MASNAHLALVFKTRDQASAQLRKFQKQLGEVEKSASKMSRAFKVLTPIVGGGSAGLAGAALSTGFAFNIMKENAELAFTTLLGDGNKARSMIDQIEKTASKTPFAFEDLTRASQRMLAFGFASEEVLPILTSIGDAVSAMGGGADMIGRVTMAFGQMKAKGKVSAEEMMQLAEAGIPAWQILADNIGEINPRMKAALDAGKITTAQLIPRLMKMAESGKLPADKALKALQKGMATRFGGLSEKQSKTVSGAASTFADTLKMLLGDLTQGPFKEVAGHLLTIADAMDRMRTGFRDLPEPLRTAVSWFATILTVLAGAGGVVATIIGLTGGLGGLIGVAGAVATAVGSVLAGALAILLSPLALLVLAVAGLALAWSTNFLGIQDRTAEVLGWISENVPRAWQGVVAWCEWLWAETSRTVSGAWTAVSDWFTWGSDEALRLVSGAWAGVVEQFTWLSDEAQRIISAAWSGVVEWTSWLWTSAVGLVSGAWAAVVEQFTWLKDTALSVVSSAWVGVVGWYEWLSTEARRIIDEAWLGVAGTFTWLKNTALTVIGDAWEGVKRLFQGLYDGTLSQTSDWAGKLLSWWEWIAERIRSIWAPIAETIGKVTGAVGGAMGWVNGQPIGGGGGGGSTMMAAGGIVMSPTQAIIGEAGPEAVIPLDRLAGLMARSNGGNGGGRQVVYAPSFNNYGVLAGHDAETWIIGLLDKARRKGWE